MLKKDSKYLLKASKVFLLSRKHWKMIWIPSEGCKSTVLRKIKITVKMKWESSRPDPALNQRQNGNKINTAHAFFEFRPTTMNWILCQRCQAKNFTPLQISEKGRYQLNGQLELIPTFFTNLKWSEKGRYQLNGQLELLSLVFIRNFGSKGRKILQKQLNFSRETFKLLKRYLESFLSISFLACFSYFKMFWLKKRPCLHQASYFRPVFLSKKSFKDWTGFSRLKGAEATKFQGFSLKTHISAK